MTIPKFRAVMVVFLVGFALGLSVFVASRLFVRAVLNGDAIAAAEEVAGQLANGAKVEPSGALSSILQYAYYDLAGKVIAEATPHGVAPQAPLSAGDASAITGIARQGGSVIGGAPLLPSLFGLADSAIKKVVVPVVGSGGMVGTLVAEVDQTRSLESLTRAFAVIGMVTVGLAVLAVIAVAFVVTRGRGFGRHSKSFNPALLPRDPLTDIPTRSGLTAALEDAVRRAAESDQQVGLMIVGLDGFRSVNDIWGHAAGDEVLQAAAERLRAFASGPVGVARVAGDEFAVIVEGESTRSMGHIADGIRTAIGKPFEIEGSSILLGASIGSALYPINAESGGFLFRAADSALSKAKAQGRNTLAVFDTEMKERMQRKATLERDMRLALSREEFVIFYQPQMELASGRLRGYEALVRWERPNEGILSPRDFLAVAEETGLIREIGEWVLKKACQDAASWLDSGTVAVNFSAAEFDLPNAEGRIAKVLEETGLSADRLEIEVPEHLFLNQPEEMMATLKRVKALGVHVTIDDFGGSYGGLAALAHFPFDKVKINRAFVDQLTDDTSVAATVAAIVALARTLSVDVTAEGVETDEQVTLLKAAGCSVVQGFLFGAPKRDAAGREPAAIAQAEVQAEEPAKAVSG